MPPGRVCRFPGAFPPIELDGRILIDGGIVRNLPVDIVREMGADIIICVDVGKPLLTREKLESPINDHEPDA